MRFVAALSMIIGLLLAWAPPPADDHPEAAPPGLTATR